MRKLTIGILLTVYILLGIASASSIFPLSLTTNTPYQNTNATAPLYIYVISTTTAGAYTAGYVGPTSSNLIYVSNTVAIITGVGGVGITQQSSTTMVVPPLWYYQFNYTGSDQFQGMYSSAEASGTYDDVAVVAVLAVGACIYLLFQNEALKERKQLRAIAVLILLIFMLAACYMLLVSV